MSCCAGCTAACVVANICVPSNRRWVAPEVSIDAFVGFVQPQPLLLPVLMVGGLWASSICLEARPAAQTNNQGSACTSKCAPLPTPARNYAELSGNLAGQTFWTSTSSRRDKYIYYTHMHRLQTLCAAASLAQLNRLACRDSPAATFFARVLPAANEWCHWLANTCCSTTRGPWALFG